MGPESNWQGLEIVKTEKGKDKFTTGVVEFKAKYLDQKGNTHIHHEVSEFIKNDKGAWLYDKGAIVGLNPIQRSEPKIGRNDPCSCGSGKKYKKCCGA